MVKSHNAGKVTLLSRSIKQASKRVSLSSFIKLLFTICNERFYLCQNTGVKEVSLHVRVWC